MSRRRKNQGKVKVNAGDPRPAAEAAALSALPPNPLDRSSMVQVFGGWVSADTAAAREDAFRGWATGILSSRDLPPPTLMSLIRRPDGAPWFVPLDDGGQDALVRVPRGTFPAIDGTSPAIDRDLRTAERVLLPLHDSAPERPARSVEGWRVPSLFESPIDGVLVHGRGHAPRVAGRRDLPAMAAMAAALDLEAMLLAPADGQCDRLLGATWHAIVKGGKTVRFAFGGRARRIRAFTCPNPDVLTNGERFQAMDGRTFFGTVGATADHDGVEVDAPDGFIGRDAPERNSVLLAPVFALRIVDGHDTRPGAIPLAARNLDEVALWLRLADFPGSWLTDPGYDLVEVPGGGGRTLIEARSRQGGTWTPVETAFDKQRRRPEVRSPAFAVGQDRPGDDGGLGPGTTRILCAGLMARWLAADAHLGLGHDLPFVTWVGAAHRAWAAGRLRLAVELLKLIPAGEDGLPRSAVLTVRGGEFLRNEPACTGRAWIEARRDWLRRHTKRVVWRR